MRSAPNFGDLLLDRRPSHFVPPEMRDQGGDKLLLSHSYRELRPSICHGDAPTTTTRL